MSWTDNDIDKLFQDSAGKASFEYNPEFWEEFSASLPVSASVSNMTDAEVDALFKADAEKNAFTYKPEYWNDFTASLPLILPTEEVTDAEVDELYRESSRQLSFKYKHSYWEEMAAMLRSRRRPDFLWFGFSGIFAVALIYGILTPQSPLGANFDFVSELTEKMAPSENQALTAQNGSANQEKIEHAGYNTSSNELDGNGTSLKANNTQKKTTINNSDLTNNQQEIIADTKSANGDSQQGTPLQKKAWMKSFIVTKDIISPKTRESETYDAPSHLNALSISTEMETGTLTPWSPPGVRNDAQFSIYAQVIGGISQSSITPSEFMSNSYGIGAGVVINKRNWTINLGSNVLVENYNDLLLTRSAKVYGFGSDLYRFDLHYKHLFVTELDLSLGYNLGRHRFNVGLRPSFAFSSEVDINETSITSSQGEMIENEEKRTSVYGFMEGVNRFGVKPMIGYAYYFKGNWTLGANLGVELLPAINEEFINGTNNRAPLDGQLYIRKNFNIRK